MTATISLAKMNKGLVHGVLRSRQPEWLERSFWPRVDKTPTCWLWMGPVTTGGYGQIHLAMMDGNQVTWSTHRLSWLVAGGLLFHDRELDHLCRVRECCNPEHLESVTHHVNMMRAHESQTHCKNGHEFTEANILLCGKYKTKRQCRECARQATRAWRARRQVAR